MINAGNTAKGIINKSKDAVVQTMDQNEDGKFDMSDVSVIAGSVGEAMKKGANAVKESAEENRKRMEIKVLQPIFSETLDQAEFLMSKLIRVVDRDKKYAESDVCHGSIVFCQIKVVCVL